MTRALAKQNTENEPQQQQPETGVAAAAAASLLGKDILDLQRSAGNQSVTALLSSKSRIQRQSTGSVPDQEEDEPIDTSGLGMQRELQGHGDRGSPETQDGIVQRQGGGSAGESVTANSTFTSNPPAITRAPAEEIANSHGRPNVAGWTTPRYDFQVSNARTRRIDFSVTMDYDMELASEYTGATLSVLQDHEMGHVNIGKNKGKAHLVDDLEAQFEGMDALTRDAIITARDNAAMVFYNEEGIASQDYDSADYPRMHQAYLGARTPLADLEAQSPTILHLSTNMRVFNSVALLVGQEVVASLAQNITGSAEALSADDRSKLQYNPEFKALVSQTQQTINDFIAAHQFEFFMIEFNTLSGATLAALEVLRAALAGFTWQAPP